MDNNNTTEQTFGERLKQAREAERYTRSALAKETGIPEKSLEKFEYGTATPTIERLYTLADTLGITAKYLLDGDTIQEADEIEPDESDDVDEDQVNEMCLQLDELRDEGFSNSWRTAPRLFAEIKQEIALYDLDELLDLAESRGLFVMNADEIATLAKTTGKAKVDVFAEIIERILDTLYFGVDLYGIKKKSLESLAFDFKLKADNRGFFVSWSGIPALVKALRSKCRDAAMKGKAPDFEDKELYKEREVA